MKKIFLFNIVILVFSLILTGCAKENTFNPKLNNKQNALAYVNPAKANTLIIDQKQQKILFKNYLSRYYSPWTGQNLIFTPDQLKTFQEEDIARFTKNPGWGVNYHKINLGLIKQLVNNMNPETFPNADIKAITTAASNLRLFPTNIPSYTSVTDPGWFYPFDNFQESYIPANLPVLILQTSKDKAWDLVLTNADAGWIPATDIATVSSAFIKDWLKNSGYINFKNDHTSILDIQNVYRFQSHMGAIYPFVSRSTHDYRMKIAVRDLNGNALIHFANVPRNSVRQIPLSITQKNIATVANQFLGMPYGWGGIYGYRDCSSTTMDIMGYFGIWLPRNSAAQAQMGGQLIDLSSLNDTEKKQRLEKNAIPFFSLVHLPGHIMLYLGESNQQPYVLHDFWGLPTIRPFQSAGRAVVGKTIISPIDFGRSYINVKQSLLSSAISITNLGTMDQIKKIAKPAILDNSRQLLLVTTPDWSSNQGRLQCYQRATVTQPWEPTGKAVPVVMGKTGLAWSDQYKKYALSSGYKKEGDNKSPAGAFTLGKAFGLEPLTTAYTKNNFVKIEPTTVCVDAATSRYYGDIIDSARINHSEWVRGEPMFQYKSSYKYGLVVNYNNQSNRIPNAGSCIFMHVWKGKSIPTVGCTAMSKTSMVSILKWLQPGDHPVLVQLPQQQYENLQIGWELPKS